MGRSASSSSSSSVDLKEVFDGFVFFFGITLRRQIYGTVLIHKSSF